LAEAQADELLVDRERLEYDEEGGSSASSDYDRDRLKDYSTQLRIKVDEIDVALARVADGSYGRCDGCYEKISQARLRGQLPAFTCIECRANV
jgi:RNA polymerase-binding transcription factor DksA